MSLKNRIVKLETAQGMGTRMGYMCVTGSMWDTPEEKARGFKIQPYTREAGGTGAEPFYLATEAELSEFAARPDVELTIIEIAYADHKTN